jgi:hypothetical protein
MSDVALIAITMPDGSVTIRRYIVHLRNPRGELMGLRTPDDEHIRASLARQGWQDFPWKLVSPTELPPRAFRAAWRLDPSLPRRERLRVDMPAAREIHRERIRARRAPLFAALDAEYMRADERGDVAEKQRVATLRQHLRDAPADPRIEAATTPEELAAVDPLSDTEERSPRDGRQVR